MQVLLVNPPKMHPLDMAARVSLMVMPLRHMQAADLSTRSAQSRAISLLIELRRNAGN
jgi:hypothetical protein